MSTIHFNVPRGSTFVQGSMIPLAVHIRRETERTLMADRATGEMDEVVSISEKGKAVTVDSVA